MVSQSSVSTRVILAAALGFGALGLCSCSDYRMQASRARAVPPEVFRRMYEAPRTPLCHCDYLGASKGNHFMAVYDPGCESWASYRFSVRTPVSGLPSTFPEQLQQPIRVPTATQAEAERDRRAASGLPAANSRPCGAE